MQDVADVFVTVTVPVIVPAAPWKAPAAAATWLQAGGPAAVELVVEAAPVELVVDAAAAWWWVVVVVWL